MSLRDEKAAELTPEERMAAQSKRPAVFQSTSPEHGKQVRRSAVTWVKISPDEFLNGRDSMAGAWEAEKRRTQGAVGTTLTWDAAAKATGQDVAAVAATVKAIHRQNPNIVVMDIDRMGNNIGFFRSIGRKQQIYPCSGKESVM